MQEEPSIRILEKDNNRRGDLFGLLMSDLLIALGYERPRLNIHKSGHELDLWADHRLENRRAIAECKATSEPIGGDSLNKFVGVLDAERMGVRALTGYFISLSGFRETAIEQERQRRRTKIITLTGSQVITELVRGRILISFDHATEFAGRYCATLEHLVLDPKAEILAHERGWIWAIYYTQGKVRSHFALIHADGTPLARALADEIITTDQACDGRLHTLSCLNPVPPLGADNDNRVAEALTAYQQYIINECGFIQLDGLPADSDVGSRRLRLENLFVPLHLDIPSEREEHRGRVRVQYNDHYSIRTAMFRYPRLALLAAPGGGKSTLIKRLALAYADPAQYRRSDDNLPEREWLPLFLRCRELRDLARGSFAELLGALSQREPVRQHAAVFRAYVDRALLSGEVLLLVDGLDEISDPGDRAAFVCTLRTALKAYPDIALIVTSREAGFRHVAAHLAPVCTLTTLSPFDTDDIRRLSVAWHREVLGDSAKVRADAEELAATITRNDRIHSLAVNPLLLTTLLLVKRWVGSLPTRRSVLYGKAVEVLLMTWNTEGHDPIPDEEALPQLCYVASAMMLDGVQKISRPRLAMLLQEARDALPTELGYVKGSVDEFIHRVEDRSSLLMMTGHDVEDGQLVEFFEFRHLTFQEFLTARAMVEGWHPARKDADTLVTVLEPHLKKERWREVIPLAAVLGGKATEALIQRLTEEMEKISPQDVSRSDPLLHALLNCLADEAAARPRTIRTALRQLVRFGTALALLPATQMLVRGRYGADFHDEASMALQSEMLDIANVGDALMEAVWWQALETDDATGYVHAAAQFVEMLKAQKNLTRFEGAVGIGRLCYALWNSAEQIKLNACAEYLQSTGPMLVPMLEGTLAERCSAAYALEALCKRLTWTPPPDWNISMRLFRLWRDSTNTTVQRLAVRALASQPFGLREGEQRFAYTPCAEIENLLESFEHLNDNMERVATLVLAWDLRVLTDEEIMQRLSKTKPVGHILHPTLGEHIEEGWVAP